MEKLIKNIDLLRTKLCNMVEVNDDYDKIYKVSTELDILINEFYSKCQ